MWTRDFASRAGLYPELLAKDFARELAKAKLTHDQIQSGLEAFKAKAAESPWMPNPSEFVDLCRMAFGEGIKSEHEAYQEACKKSGYVSSCKWSHPAVYVAGKACGWYELRTRPEKETFPRFKAEYRKALERAQAGEDLAALVPVATIEERSIFQASPDNPGRLKALAILGKKP